MAGKAAISYHAPSGCGPGPYVGPGRHHACRPIGGPNLPYVNPTPVSINGDGLVIFERAAFFRFQEENPSQSSLERTPIAARPKWPLFPPSRPTNGARSRRWPAFGWPPRLPGRPMVFRSRRPPPQAVRPFFPHHDVDNVHFLLAQAGRLFPIRVLDREITGRPFFAAIPGSRF